MQKKNKKLNFKEAVLATPDIKNCYQPGLKALRTHSKKITFTNTSQCGGSVDIDACTTAKYPQESRWDYCFAYKGEVHFVEVHSANTSQVSVVLKKLQWLKDWLTREAPEINKLKAKGAPYYWVQSGKLAIPAHMPQFRQVVAAGIKPIRELKLD